MAGLPSYFVISDATIGLQQLSGAKSVLRKGPTEYVGPDFTALPDVSSGEDGDDNS